MEFKHWTNEEIKFLEENHSKLYSDEIAKTLDRTRRSIRHKCSRLKLRLKNDVKPNSKYNMDFFTKMSPNLSYFLGFFMADGHLTKNGRLMFGLHIQDRHILDEFSQLIGGKVIINKKGQACYSIHSGFIGRYLHEKYKLILGAKTGNEFVPEIDEQYLPHFVRGYFDGDGCITRNNNSHHFSICSASRKIIERFCQILELGKCQIAGPIWAMHVHGIYNILWLRKYLYSNKPELYLERKFLKFQAVNIKDLKSLRFSKHEIEVLHHKHELPTKEITTLLDRNSSGSVGNKLRELGYIKHEVKEFTQKEIEYLINNFEPFNPKESVEKIAVTLNRSISSIEHKVGRLKLREQRKRWSIQELEFLNNNLDKNIDFLVKYFNRSKQSILTKMWHIGVRSCL